jgi:hypothetical protein
LGVLALSALVATSPAVAQLESGAVLGTVQDADGRPLPGAAVELRRIGTDETLHARTAAGGDYRLDRAPAGEYELRVSSPGFHVEVRRGAFVHVGQTTRFDFRLVPGASADQVDSRAEDSGEVAERPDTGQVVDRTNLEKLPSKTRDFTDLAALAPGATSDEGAGRGHGSVKVLGMRSRDNLAYIDGALFTHGDGGMTFTPSNDALQEFDIKSGLYSAEYGIRPGAQIIATTKRGTNELHGNLFWFHRNDNFDARNFFELRKTEFKRNQIGGTLGGPLPLPGVADPSRAWFFVSYQLQSVREFLPLTAVTPTADERRGIFAVPIRDPLTGQPFPDRTIPANRIDPVAGKLLGYWSPPNTPGPLNFTSPDSLQPIDNPQVIARFDLLRSTRSKWSARTVWDSSPYPNTHAFSAFSNTEPLRTYGQSLANTRVLGRNVLNTTSAHWVRRPYVAGLAIPKTEAARSLGIAELLASEIDRSGIPTIEVQGYATIGDPNLLGPVIVGNWQARDDLSLQHGRHALKLGAEYRQHYNFFNLERRSRLVFLERYSGNAFADFLLGYPASTTLGGQDMRGSFHQNSGYFYAVDEWRWSPRWTLSAGLRYELRLPWREKRGFMANFDRPSGNLIPPLVDVPVPTGGSGRFEPNSALIAWHRTAGWLPRLGVAYRAAAHTVVRVSYGMYANEADLNTVQELGRNPRPGAESLVFQAPVDIPSLRLSNPFPSEARASAIPSRYGLETPLPLSISHSWGLTVQQRLAGVQLNYGYQGSRTTHRLETVAIGDAVPGSGDRQSRRPYRALQSVDFTMADADAWFQGTYVQAEKAASSDGLYLLASLSWSREMDTGANLGSLKRRRYRSVNVPLHQNQATTELSVPRRLLLTARYDLPFGPGKPLARGGPASRLLRGWSLQAIGNFQDGPWLTVFMPGDQIDAGSEHSQWPDRIRDPSLDPAERTPGRWFDTSAFARPQELRYGNAGRSTIQSAGLVNLDFSIHRKFDIRDNHRFEVRLEMYNATNHPNFVVDETSRTNQFGTPGFGAFGKALPARQLQAAVKYFF